MTRKMIGMSFPIRFASRLTADTRVLLLERFQFFWSRPGWRRQYIRSTSFVVFRPT